ncbi:MAG: CaiB/BaiF CoA-transferase family protein, partial [Acidimicrobiales bacterium]
EVAATGAVRTARRTGRGEHVDLSMLECMSITMNTYAPLFPSLSGVQAPRKGPARTIEIPSVEPTSDGYVGFCTITAQQLRDFWMLIERPDLLEDRDLASAAGRTRRMDEVLALIHAWTEKRSAAEIIEAASLMRIPVAPIGTGATVASMDHFVERGTFIANPAGQFVQPRVPYRIHDRPAPPFRPAPLLGEHNGIVAWPAKASAGAPEPGAAPLPLDGIRVVDFTMFWAGPAATQMLAALGADVIKIESVQRPDGMRFTTVMPPSVERWWEWGPIFQGANTGKRSVTLDLTRPEGRALAEGLIADADAVVENFSPRVMENFGLDWESIAKMNERAVMVRMPAFGLSGPWRDRTGFAQTMEQVSGMAWVTGFADGPPLIPRGACDPLAGMHAVLALMVALEDRETSGRGSLVEVTMVEAALNVAADQVVEHSAYGALVGRTGNRGLGAAPQGVYPCREAEEWLALSVDSDAAWRGLQRTMGSPAWSTDPALSTAEGRHADHDRIDDELTRWTRSQTASGAAEALAGHGVAAAVVVRPVEIDRNPQMRARGFFESVDHPVVGTHDLPGMPFRFAGRSGPWLRRPAPTLGQHNDEVLGLRPEERERLLADQVIGERPVGA